MMTLCDLLNIFITSLFILNSSVQSVRILLNPSSINSHAYFYSALGKKLADEGHYVRLLVSSNTKVPDFDLKKSNNNGSFEYIKHPTKDKESFASQPLASKLLVEVALAESSWVRFWKSYKIETEGRDGFLQECEEMLQNKALIKSLKKMDFQFVIVDFVAPECRYVLPLILDLPYATFSIPWSMWLYRVPRLFSFTPFMADPYTDSMTFYERLCTLVKEFGIYNVYRSSQENEFIKKYLLETSYYDDDDDGSRSGKVDGGSKSGGKSKAVRKFDPNLVNLDAVALMKKAKLWILLEDIAVAHPNALMPNTISIGDVMINDDIKPLPKGPLSSFVEKFSKKEGCVLVSFGSFFNHVPDFILHNYCRLFKKFKNRLGFIWKLNKPLETVCPNTDNILIQDWLPQNDLLANECVKLFITHGGINSIIESVSHKKPMIIVPIAMDQIGNAAMAAKKGYGIFMPLSGEFSVNEYKSNIEKIISPNSVYKQKAELYSEILRDKPVSVGKRVGNLIEEVITFGDGHLRTAAFELNDWQFFMFDIFTVLTIIFVILVILLYYWLKFSFKFFRFILRKLVNLIWKTKKTKIN